MKLFPNNLILFSVNIFVYSNFNVKMESLHNYNIFWIYASLFYVCLTHQTIYIVFQIIISFALKHAFIMLVVIAVNFAGHLYSQYPIF